MNQISFNDSINELFDRYNFKNNPYFVNLLNGNFSKEDFIETQIQLFHIVHFFSFPLSGLLTRVPESPYRMNLVENLYFEHGEGFVDEYHDNTFLFFLNNLLITKEDIKKRALWPESREFQMSLLATSIFDSYETAIAMFGMIEKMFSLGAGLIEQGVIFNGWLAKDKMQYYITHKIEDSEHAKQFFKVIEDKWEKTEKNKYYIDQGLNLGAYSFYRLFEELYHNRKQRKFRTVEIPHIDLRGPEDEL